MRHEQFLETLASLKRPDVYVELGIYQADVTNAIAPYSQEVYCADIVDASQYVKNDNIQFFHEDTEKFAIRWKTQIKKDIDLIFIDADHSAEAVYKDVYNFITYLKKDTGLMILHDTWPLNKKQTAPGYSGDCYKATKRLKNALADSAEILTLPIPYGLTLIRRIGDDWRNG